MPNAPRSLPRSRARHHPRRRTVPPAVQATRIAALEAEVQELRELLALERANYEADHEAVVEAQRELELSRERYGDLYDCAPVGYVLLDRNGFIREENLTAARMLGVPRERLHNSLLSHYVVREDRRKVLQHLARCRAGSRDEVVTGELRMTGAGGRLLSIMLTTRTQPRLPAPSAAARFHTSLVDITARKQSEEALRESEAKYRILFENMAEQVHFWQLIRDEAGRIKTWRLVDANQATLKSWGRTRGETIGRTADEIFPGATRRFLPIVRRIFREAWPHSWEMYLPDLGQHLRMTSVPIGEHFISTGVDLTEYRRMEEELRQHRDQLEALVNERTAELRESEERYRSLVEMQTELVCRFKPDGTLTFVNEAYCSCFGRTRDQLLGHRFAPLIPPEDRALVQRQLDALSPARPLATVEHRVIDAHGETRWQRWTNRAFYDPRGRVLGFQAVGVDITEHKQAEAALRASERRLALAATGGQIGIREWDIPSGKVLCTEQCARLVGLRTTTSSTPVSTTTTLLSLGTTHREWARRVHPEDLAGVEAELRRCMTRHLAYEGEYRVVWPDGSIHWIAMRGIFLYDAKGSPERMLGVNVDITARKQAEADLRALNAALEQRVAERTAELRRANETLVAEMKRRRQLEGRVVDISERERRSFGQDLHDDICSQLAGIEYLAQALADSLAGGSDSARSQARTIARLLRQAMEDARSLARRLSPLSMDAQGLLLGLKDLADQTRRIYRCRCTFHGDPTALMSDPAKALHLHRIAQEAVANAARHSHGKRIRVSLTARNHAVILRVGDDGSGMPAEAMRHKGLGLQTMNIRASAAGGVLAVRRNRHGGTEVICTVPHCNSPSQTRGRS